VSKGASQSGTGADFSGDGGLGMSGFMVSGTLGGSHVLSQHIEIRQIITSKP
jgi:hypothetical protein